MPCRGKAVRAGCLGQGEDRSDVQEKAIAFGEFGHRMQVRRHQAREHREGARISDVDGRRIARGVVSGRAYEHTSADRVEHRVDPAGDDGADPLGGLFVVADRLSAEAPQELGAISCVSTRHPCPASHRDLNGHRSNAAHKYADELYGIHIGSGLPLNFFTGPRAWDFARNRPLTDDQPADVRTRTIELDHRSVSHLTVHMLDGATLAHGLSDSPVGLLAWLLERWNSWSDNGGDVESVFTKDDLLTHATIYWVFSELEDDCSGGVRSILHHAPPR